MKIFGVRREFLKRKLKTLAFFVGLLAIYQTMSNRQLIAQAETENRLEPECAAVEALDQIVSDLRLADPATIEIDHGPMRIPNSRLSFRTRSGSVIRYFEQGDSLTYENNGVANKIHDQLVSIAFLPPSRDNPSYAAEIQVWQNTLSGDSSRAVSLVRYFRSKEH